MDVIPLVSHVPKCRVTSPTPHQLDRDMSYAGLVRPSGHCRPGGVFRPERPRACRNELTCPLGHPELILWIIHQRCDAFPQRL
eukprot:1767595-Amphidinium_carterae.2